MTTAVASTVDDTYIGTDAVALAIGATRRQVDFWVSRGYLQPVWVAQNTSRVLVDQTGTGRAMRYSPAEVQVAQTLVRLVHLGFEPCAAAKLARDPEERTRVVARLLDIIDDEEALR